MATCLVGSVAEITLRNFTYYTEVEGHYAGHCQIVWNKANVQHCNVHFKIGHGRFKLT